MTTISPSASEPEGMTTPQDLALVPKRQPPPPPGFSSEVPEDLIFPALEGTYLLGVSALIELSTLGSLEVTISTSVMGKFPLCLQVQSLAKVTLPSTSDEEYQGPSPKDKEA